MKDHLLNAELSQAKKPKSKGLLRLLKYLLALFILCLVFVFMIGAGFIYFSQKVAQMAPPEPLPVADAIIVLTGGEKRVETGLALLEKKLGARLLISGVNPITNQSALIRVNHADRALFNCCVDLGHQAINTIGNAQESADWIKRHNYRSVYIVTNDYHMPRSLREMQRLMPDIIFIAYPIGDVTKKKENSWLIQSSQLRILVSEYVKFIGAEIRSWFV